MRFNSLNIMVKIVDWIKNHIPKWVDLSHPEPWNSKKTNKEKEDT